jgi:hypothetical protein
MTLFNSIIIEGYICGEVVARTVGDDWDGEVFLCFPIRHERYDDAGNVAEAVILDVEVYGEAVQSLAKRKEPEALARLVGRLGRSWLQEPGKIALKALKAELINKKKAGGMMG